MTLFAASAHGFDLTSSVKTGLAWYYLIVLVSNVVFALYQQRAGHGKRAAVGWLWAVIFLIHAGLYFTGRNLTLPTSLRELSDHGVASGLLALGVSPDVYDVIATVVTVLFAAVLLLLVADLAASYLVGGATAEKVQNAARPVFRGLSTAERLVVWLLLATVLSLFLYGTNAITYFVLSVSGFVAFIVWRRFLTEPGVAWFALNLSLLFGGWSMTDLDFRDIIIKPDNVPIVGMVFVIGFFTWLSFRRAVLNDERIEKGEPPLEKVEDEKVLVWPDLVYTELICMIVVTVVLTVWGVALPAPLEQPASSTKTPNPSKAPWYFLGLQEMLVYYDPWLAGVVFPTIIIIGLMAIPYIDFNQKGNGYFTFKERPFAISTFLLGFIILWVTLIFLGTFLRGPNWNFFGLYEPRDPHKLVPLNNVNLSELFWIQALGVYWDQPTFPHIIMRELPGIVLILAYLLLLPPLLAKTILRGLFIRMGFVRYMITVNLLLFMAALPIKMVLRWAINLKYIVGIPEIFFNI